MDRREFQPPGGDGVPARPVSGLPLVADVVETEPERVASVQDETNPESEAMVPLELKMSVILNTAGTVRPISFVGPEVQDSETLAP